LTAPGQLLVDQTDVGAGFEVISIDFAGPVSHQQGKKS